MKTITELVGQPKNYGLSPEEQDKEDRRDKKERDQRLALLSTERKRRNEAALAEMAAQYEQWVSAGGGQILTVNMLKSAILILSRKIWLKWRARRKSWRKLLLFLWGTTSWKTWYPLSLRPCWTVPRSNQRTPSTFWCVHAAAHMSDSVHPIPN